MHILLPPSETKRSGGVGVLTEQDLAHDGALGATRTAVREALERLSRDEEAAAAALKLGAKSRGELANNLALGTSGVMPAVERYTGVLYDALGVETLDPDARDWLDAHVSVQSALFGLVSAGDRIPAYRLSAGSRLPGLGAPLKRLWREAHGDINWHGIGGVLDLRSQDYAELAPLPAGRGVTLDVAQCGPGGEMRALNHFNKAAKGDLVRRLAASGASLGGVDDLLDWGVAHGLEFLRGEHTDRLTLVTELGAPARKDQAGSAAARAASTKVAASAR